MTVPQIVTFLRGIRCERISVGKKGWVRATCPLAFKRHMGGQDRHPSFGVGPGERGIRCFCFSCKYVGTPKDLLAELERLRQPVGPNLPALLEEALKAPQEERLGDLPIAEYRGFQEPEKVAGILVPKKWALEVQAQFEGLAHTVPEEHLHPFVTLSALARSYLTGRGLLDNTIATWNLGWHEKAKRIVIPIRDREQRLVGISGRTVQEDYHPKFVHSLGFHRDFYLYGEHLVSPALGNTAYLVEGFFDVHALWQHGYRHPVAMMGSYLSTFQIEKLVRLFDQVVLVPDGDEPGFEAARRIYDQLSRRTSVRIAPVPEGKDPDDLSREEALGIIGPPEA